MNQKRLDCPRCGAAVPLRFSHFLIARPGFLRCPACQGRVALPLSTRFFARMAGLLAGGWALFASDFSGLWAAATARGQSFLLLIFLACAAIMVVVKAGTAFVIARRLEK